MTISTVMPMTNQERQKRQRLLRETIAFNLELGAQHIVYTDCLEHDAILAFIEDLYMALDTLREELEDRCPFPDSEHLHELDAGVMFIEQWLGRYGLAK